MLLWRCWWEQIFCAHEPKCAQLFRVQCFHFQIQDVPLHAIHSLLLLPKNASRSANLFCLAWSKSAKNNKATHSHTCGSSFHREIAETHRNQLLQTTPKTAKPAKPVCKRHWCEHLVCLACINWQHIKKNKKMKVWGLGFSQGRVPIPWPDA